MKRFDLQHGETVTVVYNGQELEGTVRAHWSGKSHEINQVAVTFMDGPTIRCYGYSRKTGKAYGGVYAQGHGYLKS